MTHSFYYSAQSFFRFCQLFFRFRPRAIVTQSFCYSDSIILRSCQSFLWFHQSFFRYYRTPQWLDHFCYTRSAIFWFRYASLQWLRYFMIYESLLWCDQSFFWFHQTYLRFESVVSKIYSIINIIFKLKLIIMRRPAATATHASTPRSLVAFVPLLCESVRVIARFCGNSCSVMPCLDLFPYLYRVRIMHLWKYQWKLQTTRDCVVALRESHQCRHVFGGGVREKERSRACHVVVACTVTLGYTMWSPHSRVSFVASNCRVCVAGSDSETFVPLLTSLQVIPGSLRPCDWGSRRWVRSREARSRSGMYARVCAGAGRRRARSLWPGLFWHG
jgi:hypothetical protein